MVGPLRSTRWVVPRTFRAPTAEGAAAGLGVATDPILWPPRRRCAVRGSGGTDGPGGADCRGRGRRGGRGAVAGDAARAAVRPGEGRRPAGEGAGRGTGGPGGGA